MNRPIRKVAVFCALLFVVLLINSNIVQVVDAGSLTGNPHNGRVLIDSYERQRGDIVVDGKPIAASTATSDSLKYLRTYPAKSLYAGVTGYYSLFNSTGIERSQNGILSGSDSRISLSISRIAQLLSGQTPQGGSVTLTLDAQAQALATQLLGDDRGAVVALDPRSGAILAMASTPSYDPNALTVHDGVRAQAAYDALIANPADPLTNRATQALYPPGSTFKLIDTAAALSSGRFTPDTQVPSPTVLTLPGTASATLSNFGGESCGGPKITLTRALEISCNTAFANVGLSLGGDALKAQAEAFGFGRDIDGLGLSYAPSIFPPTNVPQTAQAAIGQFDVAATPLQMAMVAGAIGNEGVEMKPYLVASTADPKSFKTLDTTKAQVFATPINKTVAAEMTVMMEKVVQSGTGTRAQIPGVAVAGKTGTADHGVRAKPDSWLVAFAPAVNPTVAIAVLVEDGGGEDSTGGAVAAPIAQKVMSLLLDEKL